jgi:hypothetical protein
VVQTDPPPEVGLLGPVNAPAPGGVFTPTTAWAGWIDAKTYVTVWAGYEPDAGGDGVMMVMRRPGVGDGLHLDPDGEPSVRYVRPPGQGGSLTIVELRDNKLVVREAHGDAFLFDPDIGAFLSPA